MQKWEYKIASLNSSNDATVELGSEKMTRRFGERGWELVQIKDGLSYFKRPVEDECVDDRHYWPSTSVRLKNESP